MSYLAELLKNSLAMLGILALLFFVLEAQRSKTAAEIRNMGSEPLSVELKERAFEARRAAREIILHAKKNTNSWR